jgi:hypothetical protein
VGLITSASKRRNPMVEASHSKTKPYRHAGQPGPNVPAVSPDPDVAWGIEWPKQVDVCYEYQRLQKASWSASVVPPYKI